MGPHRVVFGLLFVLLGVVAPRLATAQGECSAGLHLVDDQGHCCPPRNYWGARAGACVNADVDPAATARWPSGDSEAVASAAPTLAAPPAPSNATTLDLRIAVGGGLSGSDLGVLSDAGLGLGQWIHQRYYLGALASFGMYEGGPELQRVGRLGVEWRTALGRGPANARSGVGPFAVIGTTWWAGLAAGFETLGFGPIDGGWADAGLGVDLGSMMNSGFLLTAGAGIDNGRPDPSAAAVHGSLLFSWRFYFNV